MAKIADLILELNKPYVCRIVDVKDYSDPKYGDSKIVNLESAGKQYDHFVKVDRYPAVYRGTNIGDMIEISKTMRPGAQFASYTVRPYTGNTPLPLQVPAHVVHPSNSGYPAPVQTDREKANELLQNRISTAGFLQALIGTFSNITSEQIEICKAKALELVEWSKRKSEDMYAADHSPDL